MNQALGANRPVVVHIKTVKGKGFAPAEEGGLEGMEKWHAAKPGSVEKGGRLAGGKAPADRGRAARPTAVHGGVRPGAGRRGAPRPARDRHHRRDGRRHRPLGAGARAARPLLRRRHRRAARGAVRGRPGARGHEAGVRDLLDLPAARVRPDHPRRLPAEARRGVRDGPRRPRRRRRADAPRLLRHLLPARDPEHGRDGAARRGDARAHAAQRDRARRAGGAALPARRRRRRAAARARDRDPRRHRRDAGAGRARRARRLRDGRADRARHGRAAARARRATRRSATRASQSRSTASCCTRWPRATTCS